MVTKVGELYVGRQPQYLRGVANIMFAVEEMKKVQPNADYGHLTVVGHSAGADISMYFAKLHPDLIKKVVTLDLSRVRSVCRIEICTVSCVFDLYIIIFKCVVVRCSHNPPGPVSE